MSRLAQFDVYVNPSPRSRETVPYLVVVQSDLLDALETRLVAPLVRSSVAAARLPRRLCPSFVVKREELVLLPQESAPVLARLLREPVASLRSEAHRLVDAIDAVLGGV